MRVMRSDNHPADRVDPFGLRPCGHKTVRVHILDGESMGDDLAECPWCHWVVTLRDLYGGLMPRLDAPPTGD